jgi:iron(III) transport system permease protein
VRAIRGGDKLRRRLFAVLVAVFLAFVFAGYVVYPLGSLLFESLHRNGIVSLSQYASLLDTTRRANVEAVWNSVWVSVATVVFSGILGVFLAFVFTQCDFPFRTIGSRFAVLPIALPPLVGVLAFLFAFGESGIVPRSLQILLQLNEPPLALSGIGGILFVHVYSFHVYFFLFASAAFGRIDRSQIEAAMGLGGSPWYTFRRVMLPALRPALIAASILTFMGSMASFTAPLIFAGDRHFITLEIYTTKLNGDLELAAAQSVFLTIVSVAFALLIQSSRTAGRSGEGLKGVREGGRLPVARSVKLAMVTSAVFILILELLPVATIVLLSFAREGSWTTQLLPADYTASNYAHLVSDPALAEPLLNSAGMALLALGGSLIFGVSAAYAAVLKASGRVRNLMLVLLTIPYAVPGTVVAIAFILAFNSPTPFSAFNILVGTYWILPLAYFVRQYPILVRSSSAAMERFDRGLLEAAAGLGAGPWRRFRHVVLPAILPAVVAGGALVMIGALGEFVTSVLLYTYNTRPVSVEIYAQLRLFNIGAAAAYSVVLMAAVLCLLFAAGRIGSGDRRGAVQFQGAVM